MLLPLLLGHHSTCAVAVNDYGENGTGHYGPGAYQYDEPS